MLRVQMIDDRLAQISTIMDTTLSIARGAMAKAGGNTDAGRKAFAEAVQASRFGPPEEKNYAFGYFYDGTGFAHINPKRIGVNVLKGDDKTLIESVTDSIAIARSPAGRGFKFYVSERGTNGPKVPKVGLVQNVPEIEGLVGIGLYLDDIDALFWSRALWMGGATIVLIAAGLVLASLIHRSIIQPLKRLSTSMTLLAQGKTDVAVIESGAKT
jgi:methyl-accepting chemotaxis protein